MFDEMFGNIGKKIMNYVKFITGIEFVISIIGGLFIMVSVPMGAGVLVGFLIGVIGCLVAWINGFILYGFGKLIDNTEQLNGLNSMRDTLDALNYNVSRLIQMQQGDTQNYIQGNSVNTVNSANDFAGQIKNETVEEKRVEDSKYQEFFLSRQEKKGIFIVQIAEASRGGTGMYAGSAEQGLCMRMRKLSLCKG